MSCDVSGQPLPNVKWMPVSDPETILSTDRTLFINNAQPHHAGKYICAAENIVGVADAMVELEVYVAPEIVQFSDVKFDVVSGTQLKLECKVGEETFPKFKVKWLKNGKEINIGTGSINTPASTSIKPVDYETLIIDIAQPTDQGHYTCIASNIAGADQKSFDIRVVIPPKSTTNDLQEVSFTEGSLMSLNCDITAVPQPVITWYYQNKELKLKILPYNVKILNSGRILQLLYVQPENAGDYKCIGRNTAGELQKDFKVNINSYIKLAGTDVEEITAKNDESLNLSCKIEAGKEENKTSIIWYKNGIPLENYSSSEEISISSLNLSNGGDHQEFACVVENSFSTARRKFSVDVQYKPSIAGAKLETINKLLGSTARLYCEISANPYASIFWYLDGKRMQNFHNPVLIYKINKGRGSKICLYEFITYDRASCIRRF